MAKTAKTDKLDRKAFDKELERLQHELVLMHNCRLEHVSDSDMAGTPRCC